MKRLISQIGCNIYWKRSGDRFDLITFSRKRILKFTEVKVYVIYDDN